MNSQASLPPDIQVFERGWLSSNNVLLHGTAACALVDSGYGSHAAQTLDLVRGALGSRPLDVLANTHLHSDHCGGNAALQRAYPALSTAIAPGLAEPVRVWDEARLTYQPSGQTCPAFTFNQLLLPGTQLRLGTRDWQVIAAPGHDPHSVILFDADSRTLISADALWENGFGVVFPAIEGFDAFDDVARTLDAIEALDARAVIPGHGSVFFDAAAALVRARSRLASFQNQPERHARYAAKVLVKFRLLDVQETSFAALLAWGEQTPFMGRLHAPFASAKGLADWLDELVDDLVRSGAARRRAGTVANA